MGEKTSGDLGIGAKYLRAFREISYPFDPTLNIMVNYACHGACRHCLASGLIEYQRGIDKLLTPGEIKTREEQKRRNLMRVMSDFRGAPKAFFTGGEPFMEGEEIFPLISFAAECFDEVFVNTNALAIPLNEKKAIAFFRKIPPNVTLSISIDQYHAEIDPRLKYRVKLCETLAARGLCKTAYNVRVPKSLWRYSEERDILEEYDLVAKHEKEPEKFFIHEVAAVSSAVQLDPNDTVPLDPIDFLAHTESPDLITMCLTPEGEFVNSNHAAFMVPPRPGISVVGNMFEEGVEPVLRRLAQDYLDYAKNPEAYEIFKKLLSRSSDLREQTKLRNSLNSHVQEARDLRNARLGEIVFHSSNLRWELPLQANYQYFISHLTEEKRRFLFSDAADQYLAVYASGKPHESDCSVDNRIIIENGQPRFVYIGEYERPVHLASSWHKTVRHLLEFGRILEMGRQDFFGILSERLGLEGNPKSLEELAAHVWSKYLGSELIRDKVVLNEVERALRGEDPEVTGLHPGDREQALEWFQELV